MKKILDNFISQIWNRRLFYYSDSVWSCRFECANYFTREDRSLLESSIWDNEKFHYIINRILDMSSRCQFWAGKVFIIPSSPRAVALHALIIIVKHGRKIIKLRNDCAKVCKVEFFGTKIFNLSFNWNFKTSCALPPYNSLELDRISSTSHLNRPAVILPGEGAKHSLINKYIHFEI